jgi:Zinc finger, C2H2 type
MLGIIIGKMQFNLFETRFKCKICGKVLTTKPLLNKHHKEEHNK